MRPVNRIDPQHNGPFDKPDRAYRSAACRNGTATFSAVQKAATEGRAARKTVSFLFCMHPHMLYFLKIKTQDAVCP